VKTTQAWATTAFLLTTLTGGNANAQDASFILVNNTEFTVSSVYIWPTGSAYSGSDRLGSATIESGEAYQFVPDDDVCTYNIRVTLAGSDYKKQWNNVNLCNLSTLTISYNYLNRNLTASRQ
jgi:hypothetical protein